VGELRQPLRSENSQTTLPSSYPYGASLTYLTNHLFISDSSLLKDEKGRAEMLQAWEGELPKPSSDSKWAPRLKATTRRVLACNVRLVKERRRLRGVQVRVHAKKIQLVEEQFQLDPTNEQVQDILSESQGKLAEVFQASIVRNSHLSAAKWFRYGDTCSKTFFDFHRIGKKKDISEGVRG
jgi:hypothetical protein